MITQKQRKAFYEEAVRRGMPEVYAELLAQEVRLSLATVGSPRWLVSGSFIWIGATQLDWDFWNALDEEVQHNPAFDLSGELA